MDRDIVKSIPTTVAGAKKILQSASKTPSIKRVVYTSSQAAIVTDTSKPLTVTQNTWNDAMAEVGTDRAKFDALPEDFKGMASYAASKTLAEQACWEYMAKEKPDFTFNSVVPNFNTGPTLAPNVPASSSGLLRGAFQGSERDMGFVNALGPMHYIDVRDDGRLHVAAAIYEDIVGERIWGMADQYNLNDVIKVFAKKDPAKWKDAKGVDGDPRDQVVYNIPRSREILRRLGREDFVDFEESVTDSISGECP